MSIRNGTRRFAPSLPSGKNLGIALASAAAGAAIAIVAVSQPFQSWGRSEAPSVATVPQAITNLVPGSGVTNNAIQPSAQERRLSPSGTNGFRDFDPDLVVPNVSAAAAKDLTPFYESISDLSGEISSPAARKLSPTGAAGFKDFDPAVTYDR